MRITTKQYCALCLRDFDDIEVVFYMPNDNDCLCRECSGKVKTEYERAIRIGRTKHETREKIIELANTHNAGLQPFEYELEIKLIN